MPTRDVARMLLLSLAVVLPTACQQRRELVDLPQPPRQEIENPICEQPQVLSYDSEPPACDVPGDPCDGFTLAVEVTPQGRASGAYAEGRRSEKLDACMTASVRGWRFLPGRDCGRTAVAGVWKRSYSAVCDEMSGGRSPRTIDLPPPAKTLPIMD